MWWDIYLYFDSSMTEPGFKTGLFLRSEYSALGQALNSMNQDYTSFIGYNNEHTTTAAPTMAPTKTQSRFYDKNLGSSIPYPPKGDYSRIKGAHEKGMVAWDDRGRGLWLQHTLPNFPNIAAIGQSPWNAKDHKFNVVRGKLDYPLDSVDFLRFSYLGWNPSNVFPWNIANPIAKDGNTHKTMIKSPQFRPA
ncbi:hypothetical protein SAMD00019534_027060 [Acytostelium subglobosum LB1]|uniref:hypothetical protein n=1 Tax=Acytostelium subglobosum LB1 TaxID=1410327 RepID=UPI00064514C1|nr:hypothetical protein SAMD00019534_027060 [Acytostelium subglobosum LB1]GAM19531.1 hypothetical protein SAMD00019534_027060 [Acytostelium subglobosum LB1]|eukprot:XP_012757458.1 hypothetical protein SAMD00019534_027060 [Acytostelium subglobosum LB1]